MLSVHEQDGTYYIQTNKDSNVPEIAFEVAVIIRCLLKDGFIKNVDEFVDFVIRLLRFRPYFNLQAINFRCHDSTNFLPHSCHIVKKTVQTYVVPSVFFSTFGCSNS